MKAQSQDWYERAALKSLEGMTKEESDREDQELLIAAAQVFAPLALAAAIREMP